jgi:hypothetical protein
LGVYWSSSNEAIAVVGRENGVVVGRGPGVVTIFAYSAFSRDSQVVTVRDDRAVVPLA